ncbi:MAG TPA: hypothetical protein VFW07_08550 [Parafilimonas sp.]|nr:hypothetical protein [Parafilimonas sp.]
MRIVHCTLLILFTFSFAKASANTYTGSTPAGVVVRTFLGISLKDSIDFIRWLITLDNSSYMLDCNYGISKPNTNGFIDGGKKIKLSGNVRKKEYYYLLQNGNKVLKIASINNNLLHFLDANNNLAIGNSGWSYTLNDTYPVPDTAINFNLTRSAFKDSMTLEGRSPCGVPGIIPEGMLCYKLKWYIVLYTDGASNASGTYKVYGTPWRKQGGMTGHWKLITTKSGHVTFRLNKDDGSALLNLLQMDNNIFVFTDAANRLLVGNQDFSYTLNRFF